MWDMDGRGSPIIFVHTHIVLVLSTVATVEPMYEKPRPFFLPRDFSDENPDSYFFLFAPWLSVAVGGRAAVEFSFSGESGRTDSVCVGTGIVGCEVVTRDSRDMYCPRLQARSGPASFCEKGPEGSGGARQGSDKGLRRRRCNQSFISYVKSNFGKPVVREPRCDVRRRRCGVRRRRWWVDPSLSSGVDRHVHMHEWRTRPHPIRYTARPPKG